MRNPDEFEHDYDTGPFCRHWSDPDDCEARCTCGHHCAKHDIYTGDCMECGCEKWEIWE